MLFNLPKQYLNPDARVLTRRRYYKILHIIIFPLFSLMMFYSCSTVRKDLKDKNAEWVGTWTTAPQLVEPRNDPPEPGLSNNTLRQVLCVSLGGEIFRMRFSNKFSTGPVTMKAVHIAKSKGGSAIDPETDLSLTFNGNEEVVIEPGSAVTCDPFNLVVEPRTNLTVTIYFGETSPDVTGHPGSRTTSYILTGNEVSTDEFTNAVTTDHWYVINNIDVSAPKSAAAVAVIGNSITDGRGSGTNKQNRWPDELAKRLLANPATSQVAVLNQGIGGNCVLRQCLGPSAVSRFKRDVIDQSKVKWLIIFEGINDIGQVRDLENAERVVNDLLDAYEMMIDSAHSAGIKVYGATLLPFKDSFYDSEPSQIAWRAVNDWISTGDRFDAVIDLAEALADPANPLKLLPEADDGDHLHPSEKGHRMIAEAIDLSLFQ